mgnify:CR=1 FL=1
MKPLTTVSWSRRDMGTRAAELILGQIEQHGQHVGDGARVGQAGHDEPGGPAVLHQAGVLDAYDDLVHVSRARDR